jgi:hypothetical protein
MEKADFLGFLDAEDDKAVDKRMLFIPQKRSYFLNTQAIGVSLDGGEATHIGRQYFPDFRHIFSQKIQINFEYPAHHMV